MAIDNQSTTEALDPRLAKLGPNLTFSVERLRSWGYTLDDWFRLVPEGEAVLETIVSLLRKHVGEDETFRLSFTYYVGDVDFDLVDEPRIISAYFADNQRMIPDAAAKKVHDEYCKRFPQYATSFSIT